MLQRYGNVNKFIAAMIAALGVTTLTAILQGIASPETLITGVLSLLGAIGVYQFENKETGWQKYIKAIVAILTAVGVPTLNALVTGHLTPEMLAAGIVLFVGASSVYGAKNDEYAPISDADYITPEALEEYTK